MKSFLKNGGIWLVFAGVVCLVVPFFGGFQSNGSLGVGGALIVAGFIAYIVINKYVH
jgi:hypothetical protein